MRQNRKQVLAPVRMTAKKRNITKVKNKFITSGNARVLINRSLGGIGDMLMLSVALRELKRSMPGIHLTVAINRHDTYDDTYYKLYKNAPFIDEIVDSRYIRPERFDNYFNVTTVCINYESTRTIPRNRISIFADTIGIKKIESAIPFYKEELNEANLMEIFLDKYKGRKKVFIHTASMDGKRSWDIKNTLNLIRLIERNYPEAVIFVSDFNNYYSNWPIFKNVIEVSEMDVRRTASLIKRCDLFVGPDSGPMHIAAAVGTKSLVIFGSIPPEARINLYPTHKSVQLEGLPCLGCWYRNCPYNVKCMKDLTAEMVFKRIRDL